jgi:hypothetical protein
MVPRPHRWAGIPDASKFGPPPGRAGSARPVERERPSRPSLTAVRDRSSTPSVAPQGLGWRPPLSEPETVRGGRADGVQTHTGSASSGADGTALSVLHRPWPQLAPGREGRSGLAGPLRRWIGPPPPDRNLGGIPPMPLCGCQRPTRAAFSGRCPLHASHRPVHPSGLQAWTLAIPCAPGRKQDAGPVPILDGPGDGSWRSPVHRLARGSQSSTLPLPRGPGKRVTCLGYASIGIRRSGPPASTGPGPAMGYVDLRPGHAIISPDAILSEVLRDRSYQPFGGLPGPLGKTASPRPARDRGALSSGSSDR